MKYTIEVLAPLVKNSVSYSGMLRLLGKEISGGSVEVIKNACRKLNMDTSHFRGRSWRKGLNLPPRIGTIVYLKKGGPSINSNRLRERLVLEGLLVNICRDCGLGPVWNGKPIVPQLEHVDGDRTNNELQNLCILCPNCHTQTLTHSRIKALKVKVKKGRSHTRKVERPDRDELERLVWSTPTTKIADRFGVSGKAIEKWCKFYEISKPGQGYWTGRKERA